ncbi:hypothetical protein [Streptomyces sp. UG1]|uniref:hypothetical protein n=1 Tax=Streptomyces sp. UG1 TaxID=3417652 RepID=UPI003CE82F22
MPAGVQDEVVADRAVGYLLAGVVDDVGGAEGADQVSRVGDADAADMGTVVDGVRPDASGGPDDQYLLSWAGACHVEGVERGDAGDGKSGGLVEGQGGGPGGELFGPAAGVFGKEPSHWQKTSSPGFKSLTFGPTASTAPAACWPRTR